MPAGSLLPARQGVKGQRLFRKSPFLMHLETGGAPGRRWLHHQRVNKRTLTFLCSRKASGLYSEYGGPESDVFMNTQKHEYCDDLTFRKRPYFEDNITIYSSVSSLDVSQTCAYQHGSARHIEEREGKTTMWRKSWEEKYQRARSTWSPRALSLLGAVKLSGPAVEPCRKGLSVQD